MIILDNIEKLEIFYIRHADTSGAGYAGNSECDIEINENGEKQLKLLGERFRGRSFDAILCSPLVRCVKTAEAINRNLSSPLPVEIIPELMENGSLPGYKGTDFNLLSTYSKNAVPCKDKITDGFLTSPDEENDKRAKAVIDYIRQRFDYGSRILVVSHGSFGNHFVSEALGIKDPQFIFSISHTSVTKIKYTSDGKVRLSFSDDISHLRPLIPDCEYDI